MANALMCDSCGKEITDLNNRVQVLIFTTEPIADPQVDLCAICGDDVINSPQVERGQSNAKARIAQMMAPVIPASPEIDGVHPETGEYLDMPIPMKAVVPGIDPVTGQGQRADGRPNDWHGEGQGGGAAGKAAEAAAAE